MKVDKFFILGETYGEIKGLVQTVLQAAAEHGNHNIMCILDQNME